MAEFVVPQTRYARSGDINIAYQVVGDGPIDLIIVPGSISHVEMVHELPAVSGNVQRLARFARVISFDKRGQGLSDRFRAFPLWKSEWTMYAPSWTLWAPEERF